MQPPLVLYVPRRFTLGEVSAHTGLAIHRYGATTSEDGLVKGCVVMDVPPTPGRPPQTRRAFYGEPKGDLDRALESAAEVALHHLCDEYGIVIENWNHPALAEYRQSLLVALEASRKRTAEIKAQEEVIRRAHDRLVQRSRDICLQFADVLPVRAGGPSGIEYVGPPSPPIGGIDMLALDLVQTIQSGYDALQLSASSPV